MRDEYIENMKRGKYLSLRTKLHASLIFSSVFLSSVLPLKKIEEPRMIFSEEYVKEYIKGYFEEKGIVNQDFGVLEKDTLENYGLEDKKENNYLIFKDFE
jgi:hypothetical protein